MSLGLVAIGYRTIGSSSVFAWTYVIPHKVCDQRARAPDISIEWYVCLEQADLPARSITLDGCAEVCAVAGGLSTIPLPVLSVCNSCSKVHRG